MLRRSLPWVLALVGCGREAASARPEGPRIFGLYAVWFAGSGDEDRQQIDRFLDCLIDGSTL